MSCFRNTYSDRFRTNNESIKDDLGNDGMILLWCCIEPVEENLVLVKSLKPVHKSFINMIYLFRYQASYLHM